MLANNNSNERKAQEITLPEVEGMTADEAQSTLEDLGFTNIILRVASSSEITDTATWTVSGQYPAADSSLESDEEITLTCKSPEMVAEEAEQYEKNVALAETLSVHAAWQAFKTYGKNEYPYGFEIKSS